MKLKELRIQHQKNQEEVAAYLGIQQNSYSSIETGRRRLNVEYAKKLGDLYKIDWWLLYEN